MDPRSIALAALAGLFACLAGLSHAQAPGGPVARAAASATANILAIKGNVVTIVNARGAKRTLELATAKGLLPGDRVGWCEEDCRALRTAVSSIPVTRVLARAR